MTKHWVRVQSFKVALFFFHSPQANLSIFVSRGDAVVVWMTGNTCERVLASLLVVFFQGKPVNGPHDEVLLRASGTVFNPFSLKNLTLWLTCMPSAS